MSVSRPRSSNKEKLYQSRIDVMANSMGPDNFELLYNDTYFVFNTGAAITCSSSTRGATNIRDQVGVSL